MTEFALFGSSYGQAGMDAIPIILIAIVIVAVLLLAACRRTA